MTPATPEHVPVLLEQAGEALNIKEDGQYIDCTYGRGGHSQIVLDRLSQQGQLWVFDQDPAAIQVAQHKHGEDNRVHIVHDSFANLLDHCSELKNQIDGILFDLGVSSPQLDQAHRGFSFSHDGPLDMRMNTTLGLTAAQWLQSTTPRELTTTLRDYGEEKFAKKIAYRILDEKSPITTTHHLAEVVKSCYPPGYQGIHPATRTFQAIRIFINKELEALEKGLDAAFHLLKAQGRLAVISFHSLEDRLVKRFIRSTRKDDASKKLPIFIENEEYLRAIGKLILPSEEELASNPRARSGRLRVAEKVIQ